MGSLATSDGVYTWRLHFQDPDDKDQRKMQTQTLRVNQPLQGQGIALIPSLNGTRLGDFDRMCKQTLNVTL